MLAVSVLELRGTFAAPTQGGNASLEPRGAMSSTIQTVEPPATAVAVKSRLLAGLLVVQIIVGFEFFWSVLTKLVRGGFVSRLGADLQDRVKAAPAW